MGYSKCDPVYDYVLKHSAKGTTWDEHKYVKKVDGRYYYPEDMKNLDDMHKVSAKEQDAIGEINDSNWNSGKYDENMLRNIEGHNNIIKNNIEEVTAAVNDFMSTHEMTEDQKKIMLSALSAQIKEAKSHIIDLREEAGRNYVANLGKKRPRSREKNVTSGGTGVHKRKKPT